jgi:hypothetical protein
MLKISIPTPCHEDWNKMTPDETGRHCSVCVKSVVDFTNMSDEEVQHFFLNKKKDESVCGRFKQTQLHRIVIELPQNILSIRMPLWKKFLAACLIVFSTTLFSCDTKIADRTNEKAGFQDLTGVLVIKPDTATLAPPPPPPAEMISVGQLFCLPTIKGDIDIIEVDTSVTKIVTDTVGNEILQPLRDTVLEQLVGQVLIKNDPIKPVKTKDPQKADPENCKTIKNYN